MSNKQGSDKATGTYINSGFDHINHPVGDVLPF